MKLLVKNIIWLLFLLNTAFAQSLHGTIREFDSNKKLVPLPGASVHWLGTSIGK